MLFTDEHDFSLLPKCFFMAAIIVTTLLAGYLMFKNVNNFDSRLTPYAINGNFNRQVVLIFCLIIYDLRLFVTVFVFLERKMSWREMFLVSGLMSFALFSFAKVGGSNNQSIGILDYFSIMLFIPLAMAVNFIFIIIPRLDKYLAHKYGEEFQEYAGKTKKLIPGIY